MKGAKRFFRISGLGLFFGLVVLFLISSSPGQGSAWNPVWQFFVDISAPFQSLSSKMINAVENFWLNYFQLVGVRHENQELMKTIESLKMENSRYREALSTHERLTALLQFKQSSHQNVLAAQVIGLDPSGWFKSIIINKGKEDGLELDMPVVNADGIVGRVVALSSGYAKVLLIIDQNSAVDCLTQRSRVRGIVKGFTSDRCEMDYVEKSGDVAEGDMIVASGLGGIFPKGIPVGVVTRAEIFPDKLFMDVEIKPSVDFSKLEEVLIILKEDESSTPQGKQN